MRLVLLCFALLACVARAEVEDVKTPRGETVRLLVEKSAEPRVTVVLFAGGHGAVGIGDDGHLRELGGNFLLRSRGLFQQHGALTAVIDAPGDHRVGLGHFRVSAAHADDVGAVVRHLKGKYRLPVWLVGTSRGTESVANAGARLAADRPDGIVLTASILEASRHGTSLLELSLDKIRLPVLIAHHRQDECFVTPAAKVEPLRKSLANAAPVKVLLYDGGSGMRGDPCQARHYHGFVGIEERVVAEIMAWIKAPAP